MLEKRPFAYTEEKMADDLTSKGRNIVEPSILAGFQEFLPKEQMLFTHMLDAIRYSFESYGFIPLDTPVLEKSQVLLAKSGGDTAKQVYRFEKGDTDMAMRFDLTVPLARYVAQHYDSLVFPFRRYHIGKVYRGERPQKGRFREFYQCDIDIIGNETLSLLNEAELVSVINSTFGALDIGDFTVMINNRKLLGGFFSSLGIDDPTEALRAVDKLDKIGGDKVLEELVSQGVSAEAAGKIIALTSVCGAPETVFKKLDEMGLAGCSAAFDEGLSELKTVCAYIKKFGVPEKRFCVDLKIARGLDYYTGTVYETKLNDYPELGSICSGGRYDDLASNYTKKKLPGVGISIGLSRLFYQLNAAGIISIDGRSTPSEVLLIPMGDTLDYTLDAAEKIRSEGIPCETYMGEGKLGKKFGYADKLGIPYAVVIGEDERDSGIITVKDMRTGEQRSYESASEFARTIKKV